MGDTVESLDTIFIQFDLVSYQIQISNISQRTVGLILRRLGSNEVRPDNPSPEMTKNIFFLILKIWLITIEGIRSDTLDLNQVRIVVSRIKFFQTQKQDHIRLPPIYNRKSKIV